MNETEDALHNAVASLLPLVLPRGAVWTSVVNEGKRGWRAQKMIRRHKMRAGWPDIQIFYRGQVLFIELKSAEGRLSDAQKELHPELAATGFPPAVCRSLEDVEQTLVSTGFAAPDWRLKSVEVAL